ncbi:cupin domain-containing protein [Methylocystis sp.]|uniref:cupin domain-containing protein n=1 Tax=Methylocystis sp. TaxID=1911079 RepID=UPI0025E4D048|nr:cupin domain-containing protein [Methylocystis sp.]
MRILAAIVASAAISLAASNALGEAPGFVYSQDRLEWKAGPPELPRGAEVAMLFGDPMGGGPYILRMRAPKGYKIGPHKHNGMETMTVLSGAVRYGQGNKLEANAEKTLGAGGFAATPAEVGHWVSFDDNTVIQVTGIGPWNITYLDPRDDPRAAQR